MFDIDVHILTRPTSSKEWLAECIDSLKDEPVNLYVTQGVEGSIGQGRYHAFKLGNAPFVSFVDDDDLVVPGIYSEITNHLRADRVVFTDEILIDKDGNFLKHGWSSHPEEWTELFPLITMVNGVKPRYHHLVTLPRDQVIQNLDSLLLDTIYCEPNLVYRLAGSCEFMHLKSVGYKYRIHDKSTTYKLFESHFGIKIC
jgi:hypothetical protein